MADKRHYTPELAVSLQMASDAQISPDGAQVAFVVAPIGHEETIPVSHIWMARTGDAEASRQFTSGHSENRMPRWSPDGKQIAFLSDRAERGTVQLHVINADGGEARRLTDLRRGADLVAWHPDGTSITYTADRRVLAGEQESKSDVQVASQSVRNRVICQINADGTGARRVLGPADGHVWNYAWRPDGGAIAAVTTETHYLDDTSDRSKLVVFDPVTRVERELLTFHRTPAILEWSPDGRSILAIEDAGRAPDDTAVMIIDPETGNFTPLEAGETTPIWASWVPGSDNDVLVAAQESLFARIDRFSTSNGKATPVDVLPEGGSLTGSLSLSADGATLAAVRTNPYSPPEVWAGPINAQLTCLTHLNPQLDDIQLAPMKPISWEASDGLRIDGWLLTPPDAADGERLPLVADVHGGPSSVWGATFHATWHDWGQIFAAEGYAVLLPNPRGSVGRGQAFTAANHGDLGGMDYDDVLRGVDHLIEQGVADPDRLAIAGWSYGGFLSAWAIGHTDRFKVALCGAAVTNWPSKIGTTDIRTFNEERFSGPLHKAADEMWERSPIRYLSEMNTPTLVVHGGADPRVPTSQGMELYLGLREKGVPTDFVVYPRQKHAFHERAHQLDILKRITGWFRQYL